MNLKVSIITPSYNSQEFIVETIESVINQTYENWELIIIDDCSTDNTLSIIDEASKKDKRIRYIVNETNSGAAVSRNKGIENATGRYIAFLDSDDIWKKDKLNYQLSIMKKDDLAFTHTSYSIINNKSTFLKNMKVKEVTSFKDLLQCNYIFCSTVMLDVEKFKKIKMPNIRRRQDWGLWLILLKETNYRAIGINKSLCGYRVAGDSLSSNKLRLIKFNYTIYRHVLNFNILKTIFYFFRFFIFHFKKKIIHSKIN